MASDINPSPDRRRQGVQQSVLERRILVSEALVVDQLADGLASVRANPALDIGRSPAVVAFGEFTVKECR